MENLIYYPSFEPHDVDWLKYALVYIDQFSPIIPERGKSTISNTFKEILDKTDLIKIQEPKWHHGENAATKVLREIEYIESHPEQFRDKFNVVNIDRTWKDKNNWNYELYEEKFNFIFENECINKGLGARTNIGLQTSKELAQLYMTFLAEEIAFENLGNPITDAIEFDQLTTYLRAKSPKTDRLLNSARAIVKLKLPQDIRGIDIEKFIEFREKDEIKKLRTSFNNSLNKFYESLEDSHSPEQYIKTVESTNKEFVKEIGLFFGGLVSTTLGGIILINNPTNVELAKQVIDGTILTIGGGIAIAKAWSHGKNKRRARKFLSRVNQIGQ